MCTDRNSSRDSPIGELFQQAYTELHDVAEAYMRQERPDHTLRPTALINEAYMRLAPQEGVQWQGRAHFVRVAAQAMRRILVDHARRHRRRKRGGKGRVPLHETMLLSEDTPVDLIALDEALGELAEIEPDHVRLVELRFFGGLSIDETAEVLETSRSSVVRAWRCAQAWLYHRISKGDTRPTGRSPDR